MKSFGDLLKGLLDIDLVMRLSWLRYQGQCQKLGQSIIAVRWVLSEKVWSLILLYH